MRKKLVSDCITFVIGKNPGIYQIENSKSRVVTVVLDRLNVDIPNGEKRFWSQDQVAELSFFEDESLIAKLTDTFGGYCGGDLPIRSFWGVAVPSSDARKKMMKLIRDSGGSSQ